MTDPGVDWKARRQDAPFADGELATLMGFLDFHRAALEWKCGGLTAAQLAQRAVPSSDLSLLGLVRHMADVERGWFDRIAGNPERADVFSTAEQPTGDFDGAVGEQAVVDEAFESWRAAVADSRSIASAAALENTFAHHTEGTISTRWTLIHMVEEYARHNGHADLLREAIDGETGE